jgi:hypothetical protein
MLPLLLLLAFSSMPTDLERNVKLYWDALMVGDKASALGLVHPDDLNNFINRREARFNNWTILDTRVKSDDEIEVKIQLQRILANGVVGPVKGWETWVKHAGQWKVRVQPSGEQYRSLLAGRATREKPAPAAKSPDLEVGPKTLTFYAVSPRQSRFLHIWNGLEEPVELLEIVLDSERFQVQESPSVVAARSSARVKFQYTGDDSGENLQSEFLLRLKQGNQTRDFRVPVVYNYMDEISRWLQKKQPQKQ